MRTLAVVERGYRGAVDKQFFTPLYLAVELHRQLGGLDLLLRGDAVTCAVTAPPPPPLRLGGTELTTLADPRRELATLQDLGVGVWVEEPDLAAHGIAADRLLPGVGVAAAGGFAVRWPEYRTVCFL